MKPFLGAEIVLHVGKETVVESASPDETKGVVFEDDGETGYFYARDFAKPDSVFVDALHIYNVRDIVDRDQPSALKILWTRDSSAAALLINLRPYAVFHFGKRCSYAQDPFPPEAADPDWIHLEWTDEIRGWFFPNA